MIAGNSGRQVNWEALEFWALQPIGHAQQRASAHEVP